MSTETTDFDPAAELKRAAGRLRVAGDSFDGMIADLLDGLATAWEDNVAAFDEDDLGEMYTPACALARRVNDGPMPTGFTDPTGELSPVVAVTQPAEETNND